MEAPVNIEKLLSSLLCTPSPPKVEQLSNAELSALVDALKHMPMVALYLAADSEAQNRREALTARFRAEERRQQRARVKLHKATEQAPGK